MLIVKTRHRIRTGAEGDRKGHTAKGKGKHTVRTLQGVMAPPRRKLQELARSLNLPNHESDETMAESPDIFELVGI